MYRERISYLKRASLAKIFRKVRIAFWNIVQNRTRINSMVLLI